MRRNLLIFVACVFVCGCSSESGSGENSGDNAAMGGQLPQIEFTELGKGEYLRDGANTSGEVKVMGTIESYNNEIFNYLADPPELDFETGLVIVADMGTQPSAGYSIEIIGVTDAGDNLLATVHLTEPGSNCVSAAVITNPYHVIYVPAKRGVSVAETTEAIDCQ